MLSRRAILLKSGIHRLGQKSESQTPMSASFAARQQRDQKDKAQGNASGAIKKMLSQYMNSVNTRKGIYDRRGNVRRMKDFVQSRTTALPADLLSEDAADLGGMVGGVGERVLSGALARRGAASREGSTPAPKRGYLHNPLRAAVEAAEGLATTAKTPAFDAPWLSLHKNRRRIMGTRGVGAAAAASSMYTQFGLENSFGADPLDGIALRINDDILGDLHFSTVHPLYCRSTRALRWESVRRLTMGPALFRPMELIAAEEREEREALLSRRKRRGENTSEGSTTEAKKEEPNPFAMFMNISPRRRTAFHTPDTTDGDAPSPALLRNTTNNNSTSTNTLTSRGGTASRGELSVTSAFRHKRLLKIPSWPLAALVLDGNAARNSTFVSLPQRWHDAATGDNIVGAGRTVATTNGGDRSKKEGGERGKQNLQQQQQHDNLMDVTAKAMRLTEAIASERHGLLGQSPTSTLYQLQAVASLGTPLVGTDELLITAALSHWNAYGARAFSNNFAADANEQLVVLRCVFHIALARAAAEQGLIRTAATASRKEGSSSNDGAEGEDDPIASEEAIAAAGQFLLRNNPLFPKQLAQSAPAMLRYYASRGLLLDWLEVQWHWTLWMGGGLPDVRSLETTTATPSSSSGEKNDADSYRAPGDDFSSSAGGGSSALIADGGAARAAAVNALYPNTATADCARSAAFLYWRHTCGLTGPALRSVALRGGAVLPYGADGKGDAGTVEKVHVSGAGGGWFAPVFSGGGVSSATSSSSPSSSPSTIADAIVAASQQEAARWAAAMAATAITNSNISGNNSETHSKASFSLSGDRPLLLSLHTPLLIAAEVLRDLWDRSPHSHSYSNPRPDAPPPIPFHRRVAAVDWALGIVRSVSEIHLAILRSRKEEPSSAASQQSGGDNRGNGGGYSFAELRGGNSDGLSNTNDGDGGLAATSDLSARLAVPMGELMDTLLDICAVVEASAEMKAMPNNNKKNTNTDKKATPTSSLASSASASPTTAGTSAALTVPPSTSGSSALSIAYNINVATDSPLAEHKRRLNRALPLLLLEASSLFARCADHLLEHPAAVSPFTHMSVVDAARAQKELAAAPYVVNQMHENIGIVVLYDGINECEAESEPSSLNSPSGFTAFFPNPTATCPAPGHLIAPIPSSASAPKGRGGNKHANEYAAHRVISLQGALQRNVNIASDLSDEDGGGGDGEYNDESSAANNFWDSPAAAAAGDGDSSSEAAAFRLNKDGSIHDGRPRTHII